MGGSRFTSGMYDVHHWNNCSAGVAATSLYRKRCRREFAQCVAQQYSFIHRDSHRNSNGDLHRYTNAERHPKQNAAPDFDARATHRHLYAEQCPAEQDTYPADACTPYTHDRTADSAARCP